MEIQISEIQTLVQIIMRNTNNFDCAPGTLVNILDPFINICIDFAP